MTRISVALDDLALLSARVSASRSKPATRDHSPMYIDGAYCACRPPIASSTSGIERSVRSSRPWRASSARLSSRWVRCSGIAGSFPDHVTGTPASARPLRPAAAQALVHARERRGHRRRADGQELRRADGRRRVRPFAAPALVRLPGGDQGLRGHLLRPRRARPTAASGTGCWSTCPPRRPSSPAARAAAASCPRARSTSATTTARRPGAAPRRRRATRRTATCSPCTRSTSRSSTSTRTSRPRSWASTSRSTRSRAA